MENLIIKAKNLHALTKEEIVTILEDDSINEELFNAANETREKFVGNEVHLRALIEFSNFCKLNCVYCGIRAQNKNIERYRLTKEEILEIAHTATKKGYKTIVMQSGEDDDFCAENLAEIIKEIKKNDTAVTLSIGERIFDEYKLLKEAGADRFLLRIETTDRELFNRMHPNADFDNRIRCLKDLKEIGFELGTGCLVGLPGQTLDSLADDILFFKEIEADMVGLGPFIAHKDTPLKDMPNGNFWLSIKVMAITRLLLPNINIPATTAMETLEYNGRIIALQSGANVVMPNVTIDECKQKYEIYPGKVSVNYSDLEKKLRAIGRTIAKGHGFSKSYSPLSLTLSRRARGKEQAKYLRKDMTIFERKIWTLLRNKQFNNIKFKRQYPIGKYVVDFVTIEKMLIIEINGSGHNTDTQKDYDEERTNYLQNLGFIVIRFWNNDVTNNIDGVFQEINQALASPRPTGEG